MSEALSFDDFLDHSTRASGSGFLKNWKEDGSIIIWLHPKAPVYSLWSHTFNRIGDFEDDDGNSAKAIRMLRYNCLEKEVLLKKQNWRDRKTDEREMPPVICPHCKAVEWVREQVATGKMLASQPLFRFDPGEDAFGDQEPMTVYAGGFCKWFGRKNLSAGDRTQMRKTGIKESEQFKQNGFANQRYILCAASDSDPDGGWIVAMEGSSLGSKLQKAIKDEVKRAGGDKSIGDPRYNPYPFELTYDENKDFADKYDVVALTRKTPSEHIKRLLEEDYQVGLLEDVVADSNMRELYDAMKASVVFDKLPIDEWFKAAAADRGMPEPEQAEEAQDGQPVSLSKGEETADTIPPDPTGDGDINCDVCEQPMAEDDMECPHCGAVYAESEGAVVLASRACGNQSCDERVVSIEDDGTGVCAKCGAVHTKDWEHTLPAKKRRGRVSKRASKRAAQ